MSKRAAIFLSMAALLPLAPAAAQTTLTLPAGAWKHDPSGFTIPANVGSFVRFRGTDYGSSLSDVSVSFGDEATGTVATFYVFRAGLPDVSIATERADSAIVTNAPQTYGTLDTAGRRWDRLSLWPNSQNGALRIIYPVSGKEIKSTGLLVARHGDWLIKVRMSSRQLDAAGLEAAMSRFIQGLGLPTPKTGSAAAYAIAPCADALPATEAQLVSADDSQKVLTSALIGSSALTAAKAKGSSPEKSPVYCRDSSSQSGYSVYRAGGSRSSYVLAAGDGGVAFTVAPDPAGQVNKANAGQYSVVLMTSDRVIGMTPYVGMPTPAQTIGSLQKSKPIFIQSRVPGKGNVEILVPQGGK
ncbi:MAG: hypothetical protein J0M19_11995 [Sphingomonadales bacterium]|nr:hypothetical protein [Sphingomonadales bacterium]